MTLEAPLPTERIDVTPGPVRFMKAADLDDAMVVEAVRQAQEHSRKRTVAMYSFLNGVVGWANRYEIAAIVTGHPENLDGAWKHDYPELPEKVLLAKLRKLVRRGLINGCYCGCRGDFTVPVPPQPQEGTIP